MSYRQLGDLVKQSINNRQGPSALNIKELKIDQEFDINDNDYKQVASIDAMTKYPSMVNIQPAFGARYRQTSNVIDDSELPKIPEGRNSPNFMLVSIKTEEIKNQNGKTEIEKSVSDASDSGDSGLKIKFIMDDEDEPIIINPGSEEGKFVSCTLFNNI